VINQTSKLQEERKKLHLVKKIGPGPRQSAQHRTTPQKKDGVHCPGGASHVPTTAGSSTRALLLLSAAAANEEAASTDSYVVEPELGGGGLLAACLLGVADELSPSIVL